MTPNPPTPTPVSQGDREIRSIIAQKLLTITGDEIEQLIANYRAETLALALSELAAKDAELASLKQSILELSHPNMRMLMADRDRAIAELANTRKLWSIANENAIAWRAEVEKWKGIQQAACAKLAKCEQDGAKITTLLLDSWKVYQGLTNEARKTTSSGNVCDALDSVIRIMKSARAASEPKP